MYEKNNSINTNSQKIAIFDGIAWLLIQEMKEQWKIQSLTQEESFDIDSNLSQSMKKIQLESHRKHNQSRLYCILQGI